MVRCSLLSFTYICLNLTGPFRIKEMVNKRTKIKVWVIIYCCMNLWLIYMNIASKQDTQVFLIAW